MKPAGVFLFAQGFSYKNLHVLIAKGKPLREAERKDMRKELFRKGSPLTKATAAVLSLTLVLSMTPALAFAQPTNEGGQCIY